MHQIQIRTLDESDTPGFLALKQIGLSTDPLSFVASLDEDPPDYPQRVAARLRSASVANGDVVVGAFAPDLVGIVAVTRDAHAKRHHKADLHGMYVRPEFRGCGVGRALLIEVLHLANQMPGLETIQLVVATHNREAAALYRRFGFVDVWTELRALKVGDQSVDHRNRFGRSGSRGCKGRDAHRARHRCQHGDACADGLSGMRHR